MSKFNEFTYELLKALATVDISPLMTSRLLYVYFSTLYNCLSFFDKTIVTTDDFPKNDLSFTFNMNYNYFILEFLIPDISSKYLKNYFQNFDFMTWFGLGEQYIYFKRVNKFSLDNITNILTEYSDNRYNDGWLNANTQVPLPNNDFFIKTNTIQDNIPKTGWCPLDIDGVKQKPLNPSANVITPVINNLYQTEFEQQYNSVSQEQKNQEYVDVFNISLSLTDEQKAIAEFWAAGPKTVKPAGFWVFFMYVVFSNSIGKYSYQDMVKYYFILSASMFQAGICVWNIKFDLFEQRPIQYIRGSMSEVEIKNYFFPDITTSKLWLPYQKRTFVTPPFPDFVSGHSSFSSSACEVFTRTIGDCMLTQNLQVEGSKLVVLSSLFKTYYDKIMSLTCINVYPKTSDVVSTDPTKMINLQFNTWNNMAIQAGESRIYGGIHIASSNYTGMIVCKKICADLFEHFKL